MYRWREEEIHVYREKRKSSSSMARVVSEVYTRKRDNTSPESLAKQNFCGRLGFDSFECARMHKPRAQTLALGPARDGQHTWRASLWKFANSAKICCRIYFHARDKERLRLIVHECVRVRVGVPWRARVPVLIASGASFKGINLAMRATSRMRNPEFG